MWQSEKNIPDELEYFFCLSHVITLLGLQLSCLSCVRPHGLQPARLLCPWRFSRQEYWSELLFPCPGDLPNAGVKPESTVSPALQADPLPLSHRGSPCYLFMNTTPSIIINIK